ncbi:MAG: hypothetical protein U9O55_01450 [Patescibacteria group bacterium]|nr:hypothetical protein [Patescibacteria group bacterium]
MKWINFLHFYQPPGTDKNTIREVVKNSYSFIIKILKENRKAKITVNINASLLECLNEFGYNGLIEEIEKLALKEKIELAISAAYHPILALIPFEESIRQIKISQRASKKFFQRIKIKGFFFPEMVYDKRVAIYLKKIGIKWIMLDELAYNGKFNKVDYTKKYIDKNSGLQIIFRNRKYSKDYPPKIILDLLKKEKDFSKIIVSGTDAELYGDRHIDYSGDFYYAIRDKEVKSITVSDFLTDLKEKEIINPKIISWDGSETMLEKKQALYFWNNPKNRIHKKLWELTKFALKVVEQNKKDKNYCWARKRLDMGISSCTYWWASQKNVSLWNNKTWHPDLIIIGSKNLVRSIRSLSSISISQKLKAEKFFLQINKLVWYRHWKKYYKQDKKIKK